MEPKGKAEKTSGALAKMREPFPPETIARVDKGAFQADYIGHAEITERLLDADPSWSWEPFALGDGGLPRIETDPKGNRALWIRLTVGGVTRIGIGTTAAGAAEPLKELIGDALRNAAMRFGAGLDLWKRAPREAPPGRGSNRLPHPARVTAPEGVDPETGEIPADVDLDVRPATEDQLRALAKLGIEHLPGLSTSAAARLLTGSARKRPS